MVFVPILYTVVSAIALLGCVFIMFFGLVDRVSWNDLVSNFFFGATGVLMFWLVEGKFGPWTIGYLFAALISLAYQAHWLGKVRRLGAWFGFFGIIEVGIFLYGMWSAYLGQGA